MKIISITLLLSALFLNVSLFSQSESNSYTYKGNTYDAFIIKIDTYSVKKFSIAENPHHISHKDLLDSIPKDEWFLATASIVDTICHPLGFYINDSKMVQNVNLSSGSGNFYLKPNGIFLVTDNNVEICEASKISNYSNINLGIQSGPMLINNSTINKNFNANSTNKYRRSGVGIYTNNKGEKFVVFSISKQAVNFYDFADYFLNHHKCTNALCLESQRSVMSIPYLPNNTDKEDRIVCRYIIFKN